MTQEKITVGEKTYTILFPDLMRSLTDQERQEMQQSIEKYGVKQEVVIDTDNGVIDGRNRLKIAAELGLPVPTRIVEGLSDDQKRQLALSLNIDRRHLSPEEREDKAEARRQRVREKRTVEKKSLRTIAQEEGVSHEQIRKDLAADAGVNGLTPEKTSEVHKGTQASPAEQPAPEIPQQSSSTTAPEPAPAPADDSSVDGPPQQSVETAAPAPAKVKGKDGKQYPSTKAKRKGENYDAYCLNRFDFEDQVHCIAEFFIEQRNRWPEEVRPQFADAIRKAAEIAEEEGVDRSTVVRSDTSPAASEAAQRICNQAINLLKSIPRSNAFCGRTYKQVLRFIEYALESGRA